MPKNANENAGEKLARLLRDSGLRATKQRTAVHNVMAELGHASADMVCERLVASGVKVTTASVYNILAQFADMGIYSIRMTPGNKMFFDFNTHKHLHLYDSRNHTIQDVSDDGILAVIEDHFRSRHFKGYKLDSVEVQLVCHPTKRSKKQ